MRLCEILCENILIYNSQKMYEWLEATHNTKKLFTIHAKPFDRSIHVHVLVHVWMCICVWVCVWVGECVRVSLHSCVVGQCYVLMLCRHCDT